MGFDRIRVHFDNSTLDANLYGQLEIFSASLPDGRLQVVRADAKQHIKKQRLTRSWKRQTDRTWRTLMANAELTLKDVGREEKKKGFAGRAPWMLSLDGDEILGTPLPHAMDS